MIINSTETKHTLDLRGALLAVVDVMRRADAEYVEPRSLPVCTDEEWDDALALAEDVLDDTKHLDQEYDPSPYCQYCGSMTKAGCHCGPIAENN
jgi:hypothetical protein